MFLRPLIRRRAAILHSQQLSETIKSDVSSFFEQHDLQQQQLKDKNKRHRIYTCLLEQTGGFLLSEISHRYHFCLKGCWVVSNFNRTFSKKTVETLIRRRVLQCLVWVCTVCLCSTKRTLGLYGLKYPKHVNNFYKYTPKTLISITIKISIRLNALSLPLWHSITFDFFFQIQCHFLGKSLTRSFQSGNAKCYIFLNSTQKIKFISPLFQKIRNMKCA